MGKRHPNYEKIRARERSEETPAGNAICRFWDHMEQVHDATPEDYGMNVRKWHETNHPDCTTLPSYSEAKKP